MTQNSAQNPEGQTACQPGGQQPSAEGEHAAAAQAAAASQPTAPTAEPAAQAAPGPESTGPEKSGPESSAAAGSSTGASRPVTIAAKGFRGVFGNIGKSGKTASSANPAGQTAQSAAQPTAASNVQPSGPGFADKIFDAVSLAGPLALLLIMLAQAWPALMGHSVYCPREAAGIMTFVQTAQSGMWLAPAGDGLAHGLTGGHVEHVHRPCAIHTRMTQSNLSNRNFAPVLASKLDWFAHRSPRTKQRHNINLFI